LLIVKKILTFLVRLLCLSLLCGQVLAQGTMLNVNSQSKNPLNKRTPPPISKDKEIIKVIDSIYNPAGNAQGYSQKMQCRLLREGNDAIYPIVRKTSPFRARMNSTVGMAVPDVSIL